MMVVAGHPLEPQDPRLPERIRHLHQTLRPMSYAGNLDLLTRSLRIGIVGSRLPRGESAVFARAVARDAARVGFVIVSGLAKGIDGEAHRAALRCGGTTIGVVAGGLASIHPVRNRDLAREMAAGATSLGVAAGSRPDAPGLVLSEYGDGDAPSLAHRFQERNRIIAALSDYLVVVQARHKSGSMGTARHALELGVPIGVVPSAVNDPGYEGGMSLIRDGADAVVDGRSLLLRLELHGLVAPGLADAAPFGARLDPARPGCWIPPLVSQQQRLPLADHPFAELLHQPQSAEELAEHTGMSIRETRGTLARLEEDGLVSATPDGLWGEAEPVVHQ